MCARTYTHFRSTAKQHPHTHLADVHTPFLFFPLPPDFPLPFLPPPPAPFLTPGPTPSWHGGGNLRSSLLEQTTTTTTNGKSTSVVHLAVVVYCECCCSCHYLVRRHKAFLDLHQCVHICRRYHQLWQRVAKGDALLLQLLVRTKDQHAQPCAKGQVTPVGA